MGLVHHPNVVTDGIKFYWDAANRRSSPGTGSDGTAWTDLIKGKIGTLDNQATFTTYKGGYVEFDGTDDSVQIPNDADFTMPAGDWTICLWCADLGGNADKRHIIGTYGYNPRWIIRDTDDGAAGWAFMTKSDSAGWNRAYSTVDIQDTDDEWHYLVVTGSSGGGSGSIKLYTDGVDTSLSSSYALESITRTTDTITMGITISNGHDFMGYIASVAIYSRVLTAAEVKQNYEATRSRFAPRIAKRGMNLNWDAGDPASYAGGTTTWKDTANGLTTTFHNMDASNFNSSKGGYFAFDGTDEYMSASHSPLFQSAIADQGTFAAWFNIYEALTASDPNVPIWGAGANGSRMTWAMFQYDSSKKVSLGAKLGGNWGSPGTSDSALSYDTWYYVVFTWDKANTQVKSYINGALDDTDTTASASITTSATGWLGIGASLYATSNGSTPWGFLNGFIGVLQLYGSVLSAAEILDNYNKTKARFGH